MSWYQELLRELALFLLAWFAQRYLPPKPPAPPA
jgi:hypothetical protein